MKDSFCQMDAQSERLEVLFDASWIWFGKDKQRPSCTWKRVKSNSDLQLWEDAWKQSGCPTDVKMFNEIFLNKGDIFIFGQENSLCSCSHTHAHTRGTSTAAASATARSRIRMNTGKGV